MPTNNPTPATATDPAEIHTVLDGLLTRFTEAQATNIGFPAATDIDYTPLAPFLRHMVNNLGDPRVDGAYPIHTKTQEREIITILADLLRAPVDDWWGYVTTGASEGTEHALYLARTRYPGGIVYHTDAAHPCIPQAIDRLAMDSIPIRTDPRGEIDYDDLTDQIDARRDRPAIIVANIGTAISEAVDDVRCIAAILDSSAVHRSWIHADAALSGIPLALCEPQLRPGFDFTDGADSIIVSGHKFLGTPIPAGVLLVRDSLRPDGGRPPTYTGAPNTTLTNSRSGLAALCLWYALHHHGLTGLRDRAESCRALADYACHQLVAIGVRARRYPHAFTVAFPTPPDAVTAKWVLADHDGLSHLICMPGVTREQVDLLVAQIATTIGVTTKIPPPRNRPKIGRLRTSKLAPTG